MLCCGIECMYMFLVKQELLTSQLAKCGLDSSGDLRGLGLSVNNMLLVHLVNFILFLCSS